MSTVGAVVPSLGLSPLGAEALAALRHELAPLRGALVWVHQGDASSAPALDQPGERRIDLPHPVGFARAANAGLAALAGVEWLALVNDDCRVEPGWLAALLSALAERPRAAAAQGRIVQLERPNRLDGRGLAWNRWHEAVQLGHGAREDATPAATEEVFGVSATAALFRCAALDQVAGHGGAVFDPRLGSYYEDADLALRLRAGGWSAWSVAAARAAHAGSATAGRRPAARWAAIRGNRWAVVAGWQGRRLPLALPRLVSRDLIDLARALARGDGAAAAGVLGGWARAVALLPRFVRLGAPRPPLAAVDRFRVVSAR